MKRYHGIVVFLLAVHSLYACLPSGISSGPVSIEVGDAWVRAPGAIDGLSMGAPGALYMIIRNHGNTSDTLLKVESDIASSCQIHLTRVDSNGIASMDSVNGLEIKAGDTVELEPGGYHVMLMGLRRDLKEGEMLTFVLTFKYAGPVSVQAKVYAP